MRSCHNAAGHLFRSAVLALVCFAPFSFRYFGGSLAPKKRELPIGGWWVDHEFCLDFALCNGAANENEVVKGFATWPALFRLLSPSCSPFWNPLSAI